MKYIVRYSVPFLFDVVKLIDKRDLRSFIANLYDQFGYDYPHSFRIQVYEITEAHDISDQYKMTEVRGEKDGNKTRSFEFAGTAAGSTPRG